MRFYSPSVRMFAVVFVSTSMTLATAFAQDGNRRGGPGGFGGGGFGGRPGGGAMGGGDPTFNLLRTKEVREELEISTEQEAALGKLGEQLRPSRPEGVDFGSMSDEDRTKFFEKMRSEAEAKMAETKEKLEEVLLPDQIERLGEIVLQARGVQALSDSEVATELKITDAQKKQLEEVRDSLREEMQTKMREMFGNRDGNRDGAMNMRDEFTKMRTEMDEKILAVLTSDQKAEFEKMKGEAFKIPEGAAGFGGGGGGDRGGPGGGRPRGEDRGGRPQRPGAQE